MSNDNELRALKIFETALGVSPQERAEFVDKAVKGEPELRQRVESLLAARPGADEFLESPGAALIPSAPTDSFGLDRPTPAPESLPPSDAIPGYRILKEQARRLRSQ